MFKNRAVQLTMVKKGKDEQPTTTVLKALDMDQIDELTQIAMYHADHATKLMMSAYLAKKVIDTSSTIAIIIAQSKLPK